MSVSAMAAGRDKKMLKSFLAAVLLSAFVREMLCLPYAGFFLKDYSLATLNESNNMS